MRYDTNSNMVRVILESPYAGNVERNVEYARLCMRDSLSRGEAPFASHLLYAQVGILNDELFAERTLGIWAGFAWSQVAEKHVFYADYGISSGMKEALSIAKVNKTPIEFRTIL